MLAICLAPAKSSQTLSIGNGKDTLVGGTGIDTLTDGRGKDLFVFPKLQEAGDTATVQLV